MKTILNKTQQKEWLEDNWKCKTLHFKWGKTGSHKVTLYNRNDEVLGSAGGGGYDKQGSAFGDFLNDNFNNELKKIDTRYFYGLTHYNKNRKNKYSNTALKNSKTYVDGACGFDSMREILKKIGFELEFIKDGKWDTLYYMIPLTKESRRRLSSEIKRIKSRLKERK